MRKLALAGIVSIFATVALSGCLSVPEEDTTAPAVDDTTPVVEETTEAYEYTNTDYGFELTFLTSWGKVKENVEAGDDPFTAKITLTSENGDKEMHLFVVANEATGDAYVVDHPSEKIGESAKYAVHRDVLQGIDILEAQGEDVTEEKALRAELIEIAATFKTIEQEEGALYNYNDEALEFDYPTAWIMGEGDFNFPDTPATVKHVQWAYIGDGELNTDIWVEFRSPMLETAYMGWVLKETKDLSKDGLNIEMKILEEDKEFMAEMGDETDPSDPDKMSSVTTITDTANSTTYQFWLSAPAEDFEKYNAFVETAVKTFKVYTEGGGGIAADESANNYPPAPEL